MSRSGALTGSSVLGFPFPLQVTGQAVQEDAGVQVIAGCCEEQSMVQSCHSVQHRDSHPR